MQHRMTIDRLVDSVQTQWASRAGLDHITIVVSESTTPDMLGDAIADTRFIDGLIRDLETLRMLHYVEVHTPQRRESRVLEEFVVEGNIGECAICQEDFKMGECFVPLPCNESHPHKFHRECIQQWFEMGKDTCPMCRGKV